MDGAEEEILAEDDGFTADKQQQPASSSNDMSAAYLWAGLLLALCLYFVWTKFLKLKHREWKLQRENRSQSAEHHKDPDHSLKHLQGLEAARQKMQAAYDARVEQHMEKTKQQEEAKRAEKINNWEQHKKGLGYHNKTKLSEKTESACSTKPKAKSTLKQNDYNPLMGGSGTSGFRSSRRGPASGGG